MFTRALMNSILKKFIDMSAAGIRSSEHFTGICLRMAPVTGLSGTSPFYLHVPELALTYICKKCKICGNTRTYEYFRS